MKVRGNATYKYVFPKTQCYEDFTMKFLYDMTYINLQKLIEIYFTFKWYRLLREDKKWVSYTRYLIAWRCNPFGMN